MPEKLCLFLQSLTKRQAIEILEYLDGEPDTLHQMIELIIVWHKLNQKG